jgi:hypothetical protein
MIPGGFVDDYIFGRADRAGETDHVPGSCTGDFGFQKILCHFIFFNKDCLFSIPPEARHHLQKGFCGEQEGIFLYPNIPKDG